MKANKYWATFGFAVVIELALAGVISQFFDSKLTTFLIILAVVWGGGLAFALWDLIRSWVIYLLYGKRLIADAFMKEFRSNHYPDPMGEYDLDDYLLTVADNAEADQKVIKRALCSIGELRAFRSLRPLTTGMMMSLAGQQALREFDRHYR